MRSRSTRWIARLVLPFTLSACGADDPDATQRADGGPTLDAGLMEDASVALDGSASPDGAAPDVDAATVRDAQAAQDAGTGSSLWYESKQPIELALSGPFGDAFRAAFAGTPDGIVPPDRKKDPFAATLSYLDLAGAAQSGDVVLAVRGNSSLQECEFPKLKLAFDPRVSDPVHPFFDTSKVKIGTHCGEEDTVNGTIGRLRNEVAAVREEVVYQLARALDMTIMQTRPAAIEYTDTSSEPVFSGKLKRKAFLLEHIDELARRLGATALKDPITCSDDPAVQPDAEEVLRIKFFHAMVGNWDWKLDCQALWNTEVLVHTDGSITLVPADFDLAAFVVGEVRPAGKQLEPITAENAKTSARAYLTAALEGEGKAAVTQMKAEYLGKHDALYQVVEEAWLDAEGKRMGKLLLDGFFAVLAE